MSLKIVCPLPEAIGDIDANNCQNHFGQIVRVVFQRLGTPFADDTAIGTLATWTPLLAAVDATKVQPTPLFENFVIPGGEAITEGGDDNSTLFGQQIVVGKGMVVPTGNFRGLSTAVKKQLDAYIAEASVYGNVGVYMVNEHSQFIANNLTGTELSPFPITSWFIGDVDNQGFNTHNKNSFLWNFKGGWSDNYKIVDAIDFDPLIEL